MIAFKEANQGGRYDTVLKNATQFLKTLQFDESAVEDKDHKFGGVGYEAGSRPDLSNTQYFLDALQAAGEVEEGRVGGQAAKQRCEREDPETGGEDAAAPEPVGERSGGQDQGCERERVGVGARVRDAELLEQGRVERLAHLPALALGGVEDDVRVGRLEALEQVRGRARDLDLVDLVSRGQGVFGIAVGKVLREVETSLVELDTAQGDPSDELAARRRSRQAG